MEAKMSKKQIPAQRMDDDQLFDALREQVNRSRFTPSLYDSKRTREIAEEMDRRKWKTHKPSKP